jgi:hypothetical protein
MLRGAFILFCDFQYAEGDSEIDQARVLLGLLQPDASDVPPSLERDKGTATIPAFTAGRLRKVSARRPMGLRRRSSMSPTTGRLLEGACEGEVYTVAHGHSSAEGRA